jgi:predicted amidohydrolase YtcJ
MDFVHPDDIPRFKALNVTAQTSIQWAARDPSYFNIGSFVGMDKVENAYPVRSIMDAGANQSFGADWPASAYLSTYKPLELIEAGRYTTFALANPTCPLETPSNPFLWLKPFLP